MNKRLVFLVLLILNTINIFSQSEVTFVVEQLPIDMLSNVGIRGNIEPLSWEKSMPLIKDGNEYQIIIDFPKSDKELEFKFVHFENDDEPTWEKIDNRTLELKNKKAFESFNRWNVDQVIEIKKLKPIASEALMEDFELIKSMILDVHPGTYRYNTNIEIESALDSLKLAFSQPLSYGEIYLAMSKLTAQLKCDHTSPGFNNQNKIINAIIHGQKDKLPFTFKWIKDQMIIMENASDNTLLKRGSIVHSINNIAVLDIRNKLFQYIAADGATNGNRLSKLEVDGYDFRYNAFDVFYSLVYNVNSDISLEIESHSNQERQFVNVGLIGIDERAEILKQKYSKFPRLKDDMWGFKLIDDTIAVLTINSFGLTGWKGLSLDYKEYFKNIFEKLNQEKVDHLIIDIRKNTGGNDEIAKELFDYLPESDNFFQREGRTRYVNFPETLKPHIQTWGDNPWYFELNPKVNMPTNGYYVFKDNFFEKQRGHKKKKYLGNLYLLTSSSNTSLAFYTAYQFKLKELGLIVGQETGGNLNDINGGQILFLRLPNSKIEIDFPIMGGFALEPQIDMGLKPDIQIDYSIEDIVDYRDLEIEYLLNKIKEQKN